MRPVIQHRWDLSPKEAQELQKELASRIIKEKTFAEIKAVAGIDVGFKGDEAIAAAVVLKYPEMEVLETALARVPVKFPYIPGLLAFREGPAVIASLEKLHIEPDVLIFDGQGLAHPRRMGIATHIGLIFDKPSIGCAKSRLWGTHYEPGLEKGSYVHLYDGDEVIGIVLRTKEKTNPLYISIGHRIDLDSAREIILNCCKGHRLPEPTRLAHLVASGKEISAQPRQARLF
ncbi:MAG: deoxyribonuclease V [Chloroflexi bacterium]|nr:MAG: deoxyribonuclease V [Chloroflexota bacterium]HDN79712.1 deoxyribonuclease V [Chloroflexota bacterium]